MKRSVFLILMVMILLISGCNVKEEEEITPNSEKTVDLAIPPFAAVCRINDELSARELSLPCGSLIIIDMVHPAVTDEFCLCLNRSGSFSFGCDTASDGDLLWKTPVLRLHLIPLQQ